MLQFKNESRDQYIQAKLVDVLARNTRISSPLSLLLAFLYNSVVWDSINHAPAQILSMGVLSSALAFRAFWGFQKSKHWLQVFSVSTFFVSVGWAGSFMTALMVAGDHQQVLIMTFTLIAGLVGSTPYSLALSKKDFYTFLFFVLFPLLFAFLKPQYGSVFRFSGVGVVLLFATFLVRQRSQQAEAWMSLQTMSFELQKLLNHLPGGIGILKNGNFIRSNLYFDNLLSQIKSHPEIQVFKETLIAFGKKEAGSRQQTEIELPMNGSRLRHLVSIENIQSIDGFETIVAALDIQQYKDLEEENRKHKYQIEQSAKMAALGVMSSGLAHEINNPLATILGRVQLMQMMLNQSKNQNPESIGINEKLLKSIDIISTTVQRISKIIKGLRSFARETQGDPFAPTSLEEIVETTLSFCESRFQNLGIELERVIEKDVVIDCRSTEISQVLLNALNNAFDAIEKLEVKWVKLEATRKNKKLIITVTDSGLGIPENIREKVMIPFFTTKEVGRGTGLGLSLSRGIVESHGGEFYFNYKAPHTQLVIELPLQQAEERPTFKAVS